MFNKNYERVNWKDYPSTDTPITAENLNVMDKGISDTQDGLVEMQQDMINQLSTKADTNSICNPNLLDNGHFSVNQRGVTSAPSGTWSYGADRWKCIGATFSADGVNGMVVQPLESKLFNSLIGKTVTVSFLTESGEIKSRTFSNGANLRLDNADLYMEIPAVGYGQGNVFACRCKNEKLKAVKLELGTVSTIANDVDNYAEELIRCQGSTADSSDTWANAPQKYSVNSTKTNLTFHANVDSGRSICVVERQGNLVHITAHLTLSSAINFTSNVAIINGLPKPRTVLYPYAISRDGTVGRLYFTINGTLQTFWGGGNAPTGDGAIMIDFTYIAQ